MSITGLRLQRYFYLLDSFDIKPDHCNLRAMNAARTDTTIRAYPQAALNDTDELSQAVWSLQDELRGRSERENCITSASVTRAFGLKSINDFIVGYVIEIEVNGSWLGLFDSTAQHEINLMNSPSGFQLKEYPDSW
ncbi:MAG: hypothetical protein WCI47_00530 [bacterium]